MRELLTAPPGHAPARTPGAGACPGGEQPLERDRLLDRLDRLRKVVPVLAGDLASARRQAARLRVENRELREQLRVLRAELRDR